MSGKLVIGLLFVIVVVLTGILSVDFIPTGHKGVVTHFSAVDLNEVPRNEGLNFKTPFADNIIKMSVQTQKYPSPKTSYIDSDAGDQEQRGIRIASTSEDMQDVFTEIVVIYHLNGDKVSYLYKGIGIDYETKVIQPIMKQVVKQTMAKFSAEELVTQRDVLKERIFEALYNKLNTFEQCKSCVILEDIAITDIDFTADFSNSIESKVRAVQKALEAGNDLERIKIEALQKEAKAEGTANANIAEAKGEAEAIAIINDALANNPNYLEWLKTQAWDGKLPLVVGEGGTPFIQIPTTP